MDIGIIKIAAQLFDFFFQCFIFTCESLAFTIGFIQELSQVILKVKQSRLNFQLFRRWLYILLL